MLSQTRLIESSFPENCAKKKLNAAICSLLTAVAVAQQQQTEPSVWEALQSVGSGRSSWRRLVAALRTAVCEENPSRHC